VEPTLKRKILSNIRSVSLRSLDAYFRTMYYTLIAALLEIVHIYAITSLSRVCAYLYLFPRRRGSIRIIGAFVLRNAAARCPVRSITASTSLVSAFSCLYLRRCSRKAISAASESKARSSTPGRCGEYNNGRLHEILNRISAHRRAR